MGTLDGELERMKNEWRMLKGQWKETSELWNDSMKERFEKEFWQEFERQIQLFLKEFEKTTESIPKACRGFRVRA